jgi:hypothetical protein
MYLSCSLPRVADLGVPSSSSLPTLPPLELNVLHTHNTIQYPSAHAHIRREMNRHSGEGYGY